MLKITNVVKDYPTKNGLMKVIDNVSVDVQENEIIAIVGPSGCGKTTLLKIIAGLIPYTQGSIFLNGQPIDQAGKDRGMIFQSLSLFPWLTLRQNIGFGSALQEIPQSEKHARVNHYLDVADLSSFADFYPKDLSGGMQQRGAIARALANDPKILLMDEPFGALDAQTRWRMQEFLMQLWESNHKTIVFITHDVHEAILLADKVYVLSSRPMRIKSIRNIPFPRPRNRAIQQTEQFFRLANSITADLEKTPNKS